MKATYVLIISILLAHMLITSDAQKNRRCSKECTKRKYQVAEGPEELQAQTEELNELRSDNKELQCAVVSLNKTVTQRQDQLAGPLDASSILASLDSKYMDQLVPVLQSSSRSRFVKCWHANTDGWAPSTFHSNRDGKGPTVTIIQVDEYIFGGYTDLSWYSNTLHPVNRLSSHCITSIATLLFSCSSGQEITIQLYSDVLIEDHRLVADTTSPYDTTTGAN